MKPAQYWRKNKQWSALLGKTGTVVVATVIRVPPTESSYFGSYPFAVISVGKKRFECMGVPGEVLQPGDSVQFVLRKLKKAINSEPIPYGLKVKKVLRSGK